MRHVLGAAVFKEGPVGVAVGVLHLDIEGRGHAGVEPAELVGRACALYRDIFDVPGTGLKGGGESRGSSPRVMTTLSPDLTWEMASSRGTVREL